MNANLHIETTVRQGRTILQNSFCSSPLKLADVTENKELRQLHLMLMTSSPGTLDGDHYHLAITLGKGSDVKVETQAYQRIFHMVSGAEQHMEVVMKEGSSLVYLPHPIVPHKNAIYKSKVTITLDQGCTLQWAEIISCGRKQNNEVFQFKFYHSITDILFKGRLVVRENLVLLPQQMNLSVIGQLEGFTHQASMLCWNEMVDKEALTKVIVERMNVEEGITFGVSALPLNGLLLRVLGNKAEQLFKLLQELSCCIASLHIQHTTKTGADVAG